MARQAPTTPKGYFFSLSVFHAAVCFAVALSAGLFYWLRSTGEQTDMHEDLISTFTILVPLLITAAVVGTIFLFNTRIIKIREMTDLPKKLAAYRSLAIMRMAIVEMSAIMTLVAYFLTAQMLFLMSGLAVLFYMIYLRPSAARVKEDLALDYQDQESLDNPDYRLDQ